jgi:hypothetical protein
MEARPTSNPRASMGVLAQGVPGSSSALAVSPPAMGALAPGVPGSSNVAVLPSSSIRLSILDEGGSSYTGDGFCTPKKNPAPTPVIYFALA